ncbi:MAG: hypothetical protein HY673_23060 [Chloroflexi bacterium]|nr:hypothetical protein [Chloroflexota bacterium]
MNANERELIYKEEMYRVVGSAITVFNTLGWGFLERYETTTRIDCKFRRGRT